MNELSITLKKESWDNIISVIKQSEIKSQGNFWAALQHIEMQLEEELPYQYIDFGDFARLEIGISCQHAARFIDGLNGLPEIGKDLRIKGDPHNYHSLRIHKDDSKIFKQRYQDETKL